MALAPDPHRVTGAGGVSLAVRRWDVRAPRARLLLVHGLGDHSGRYTELAEALRDIGISTVAPDLRGHGLSEGRRGHVRRFDEYLLDLDAVLGDARGAGDIPWFLLGHSLGGLVALRYAETRPEARIRGLVLSAPFLGFGDPPPAWLHALARAVAPILPALPFSNRIDPADLSRDPATVQAYDEDPLVHDRITPRLYVEMVRAIAEANASLQKMSIARFLFLVPGADRVVDPGAALAAAAYIAHHAKVEVQPYNGWLHEPFHERERERAIADVLRWLQDALD